MKRMVYLMSKTGSINKLKLTSDELPKPNSNEVTIEVKSIGLNFADFFCIHGLYKAAPKNNLIPGLEFSGVVIDKGNEVDEFSVGDKIIGVTKFGAFATHINLDKNYLMKLSDDWSFEEGASFIVQALTAYYALKELGNVKENQIVLMHSVAGGVGIYANRIAKKFNCTTIGTVGSLDKIEKIKNEKVDFILVRDKNFIPDLKKVLNDRKIDLLLESLTGKYFKDTFNLLAPQGRAIIYGASNFATHTSFPNYFELAYKYLTRPKVDILKLIEQNRSVMGFNLIWLYEKGEYLKSLLNELMELRLDKPYIGEIFNFNQMHDAIRKFQSGKTFGKVVVKIE
ncbi:Zn-dependent oxidoreductase [Ignavibacterium album JCM 16511]|uniref:Zn-dependent oxidoreductase n=1 Tax=Ignavibacterium album (strain DSM 19864 / JCM 16511 / NBRC 101810 / Mat9-16) TaxID=945713 RepID=I0AIE0_IGNAJ|nr:zinc-binding dehydrogenase [Ignavibacterium album]AFH48747.1 Zn-dependent oxidoreductase [Ignavibacterium album JCM 16511]